MNTSRHKSGKRKLGLHIGSDLHTALVERKERTGVAVSFFVEETLWAALASEERASRRSKRQEPAPTA